MTRHAAIILPAIATSTQRVVVVVVFEMAAAAACHVWVAHSRHGDWRCRDMSNLRVVRRGCQVNLNWIKGCGVWKECQTGWNILNMIVVINSTVIFFFFLLVWLLLFLLRPQLTRKTGSNTKARCWTLSTFIESWQGTKKGNESLGKL